MGEDEGTRRALTLDQRFEPLAALARDSFLESIHRGAIASVDSSGSSRGWVGDPTVPVLLRSTAKPFQALAVVESGAAEAFAITSEELAVMAGSHAGQQEHTRLVAGLLERCGVSPDSLVCGPVVHMCSGKHAGMVALALHLGAPVAGYERVDHPVQREIARTIGRLLALRPVWPLWSEVLPGAPTDADASTSTTAGVASPSLFDGTDGCGVPVIRLPLDAIAWLYALLGAGATPGLASVRDAMLAHPELVGGRTRFDTRLMRSLPGRLVAKGGAEGVQALAVCPKQETSGDEGMAAGFAIKVEDGSARPIALLAGLCLEASGFELPAPVPAQTPPRDEWTDRALSPGDWVALVDARALGGLGGEGPGDGGVDLLNGGGKVELVVGRGDEKDLARFLRAEWPLSDEETFGRETQWIADPFALILKQRRRVLAVLKGHFLGGLASVDEFIVGRDYRSRGVGARMLARFEEEARRRGCARVVLRTVKGGRVGELLYRRMGYERECVQLDYEFGEDFVRLAHRLRTTGEGG